MIAFVEDRPSGKWIVVLNDRGDVVYTHPVEDQPRRDGVVYPMVSRDQYDADRQTTTPGKTRVSG